MLQLRKNKKIITTFNSTYELAENVELLVTLFKEEQIPAIQKVLRMNAFTMCIYGAKLRLGGGYIVEQA